MKNDFFEDFKIYLETIYPETMALVRGGGLEQEILSPNLVAPYVLDLPEKFAHQMEDFVRGFHEWRRASTSLQHPPYGLKRSELGFCTSFDFHVSNDQLKLIEINTNASLSLIFSALYDYHKVTPHWCNNPSENLFESMASEVDTVNTNVESPHLAIVDDGISQQKMRLEFFLFQELFKKHGWSCSIVEVKDLRWDEGSQELLSPSGAPIQAVYNRHTDFYLEKEISRPLLEAYRAGKIAISPNPYNYHFYADKNLLIDLTRDMESTESPTDVTRAISPALLRTKRVKDFTADDLWKIRSRFFFKPMRSYGSKGVYKGKTLTRKVFEKILKDDYLAQEVFAPGTFHPKDQDKPFKYDIRLIVFGDRPLLAGARIYRGQLTNLQSPEGGVAPVRFG